MLELLTGFVAELRRAGLPVSPDESIDAARAMSAVGLASRTELRAGLAACLVKDAAQRALFAAVFDLYFAALAPAAPATGEGEAPSGGRGGEAAGAGAGLEAPGLLPSRQELAEMLAAALSSGDPEELRRIARLAVWLHAGIEAGRPVGVSYYVQRTLRALDLDGLLTSFLAAAGRGEGEAGAGGLASLAIRLGPLGGRLLAEEYRSRLEALRLEVEAEVRRRLLAERGSEAMVASLRRPLVEDVEFMHASAEELAAMRRALGPLTRLLAARLARRRHRRRGPLDFRATIRRSLSSGGVPLELRFRPPHPSKPQLVVLADVSGSVASFARFTLLLLAAVSWQFSSVRSFLFIDGVDEVTAALRRGGRSPAALERAVRDADVVSADGHSDYGRALTAFAARHRREVGPRTTLLVLGDARNNYHASGAEVLAELHGRARHLYWLNPEPRSYWGSGDSIVEEYARHCDAVFECRNLRQLEAFIEQLA